MNVQTIKVYYMSALFISISINIYGKGHGKGKALLTPLYQELPCWFIFCSTSHCLGLISVTSIREGHYQEMERM